MEAKTISKQQTAANWIHNLQVSIEIQETIQQMKYIYNLDGKTQILLKKSLESSAMALEEVHPQIALHLNGIVNSTNEDTWFFYLQDCETRNEIKAILKGEMPPKLASIIVPVESKDK